MPCSSGCGAELNRRWRFRPRPGADRLQDGPPEEGAEARLRTRPTPPLASPKPTKRPGEGGPTPLVPGREALERRARPAEAKRWAWRRRDGVQPPGPPTAAPIRLSLSEGQSTRGLRSSHRSSTGIDRKSHAPSEGGLSPPAQAETDRRRRDSGQRGELLLAPLLYFRLQLIGKARHLLRLFEELRGPGKRDRLLGLEVDVLEVQPEVAVVGLEIHVGGVADLLALELRVGARDLRGDLHAVHQAVRRARHEAHRSRGLGPVHRAFESLLAHDLLEHGPVELHLQDLAGILLPDRHGLVRRFQDVHQDLVGILNAATRPRFSVLFGGDPLLEGHVIEPDVLAGAHEADGFTPRRRVLREEEAGGDPDRLARQLHRIGVGNPDDGLEGDAEALLSAGFFHRCLDLQGILRSLLLDGEQHRGREDQRHRGDQVLHLPSVAFRTAAFMSGVKGAGMSSNRIGGAAPQLTISILAIHTVDAPFSAENLVTKGPSRNPALRTPSMGAPAGGWAPARSDN